MADLKKLYLWITYVVLYTEAGPCLNDQHCSDCDVTTGHCLTKCDIGYFDLKCFSVCDGHCNGSLCTQAADGSGRCTEGCEPGYQGIGCNIPCDSPGGNCTACPGGCDGGYCQLGSSCVSGCVDSYYGTDCRNRSSGCTSCNKLTRDAVSGINMAAALSTGLAVAALLFIVTLAACCSYCQRLRSERFQLYVTPTQDMDVSPEAGDAPQYDVVDEARMYDGLTFEGQPASASCSGYEELTSTYLDGYFLMSNNMRAPFARAEFGQSKIRIVEKSRLEMQKERERFVSDKNQMVNEIDKLKELLHTYEQSIERKDQVISNLTHALHKQREKFDMLKKFTEWKLRHNDLKREAFASNLARKHYERSLSSRVWVAWHSVIENKWRQRVEKACQSKAQDVCLQLTNEYEAKIRQLNEELESAHVKIGRMNVEREKYEEAMKKAFMRGVCALNLEAMTMFHGEEEGEEGQVSSGKRVSPDDIADNLDSYALDKDYGHSKTIPQEAVYMTQPSDPVPPRIVSSQGSRTSTVSQTRSSVSSRPTSATSSSHRGKVITAKVTAKVDSGKSSRGPGTASSTLAPPMASVIVERHQPVTKQTIGKAAASKFPSQQGGQIYKRLAGQGSPVVLSPHIQSVKVVD